MLLVGGGLLFLAAVVAVSLLIASGALFGKAPSAATPVSAPGQAAAQPDEGKIVVLCDEEYVSRGALPQICVQDNRTDQRVQVADDLQFESIGRMAWSPDGQQIVFSAQPRRDSAHVYVINADGSDLRQVTRGAASDYAPAWSPNGQWIAFSRGHDLWRVHSDGSESQMLVAGEDSTIRGVVWSPDSQQIAFLRADLEAEPVVDEVWVSGCDGSDHRLLSSFEQSTDAGTFLAWSPDGRQVGFVHLYENGPAGWLINADGSGEPQALDGLPFWWFPDFWPPWGGVK